MVQTQGHNMGQEGGGEPTHTHTHSPTTNLTGNGALEIGFCFPLPSKMLLSTILTYAGYHHFLTSPTNLDSPSAHYSQASSIQHTFRQFSYMSCPVPQVTMEKGMDNVL